jgi:uncharacterized protein
VIGRYREPSDLPKHIPVFPLSGAILLPRSELPLNVFEPRYLEMINDSLSGERLIGIIQPDVATELRESPEGKTIPLKPVGCVGRITTFQELPDGRLRIVLTGIARFALGDEKRFAGPYRIVAADYDAFAADFAEDDSAEQVDREQLLRVLKAYLTARQLEADWAMIARAPLEPLINGLSTMSPFGPAEKQALLEAKTIKDRADVLITLAEMAVASSHRPGGGTLQ